MTGTNKSVDTSRNEKWSEAVSLLKNWEPERALASLSALLHLFPDDAEALALSGSIYLHRYQVPEAEKYLERALAAAPESVFVRLKMAEYWAALGVPRRALDELKKAESLAGENMPLRREVVSYSTAVMEKTKGSILREPPALSGGFSRGLSNHVKQNNANERDVRNRKVAI